MIISKIAPPRTIQSHGTPPLVAERGPLGFAGPFVLLLDDGLEFEGAAPLLFCRVVDTDPDAEVEFCAG
jgi:hypothetical protein